MPDNPYDQLFRSAHAALHALRSYECGNASTELAKEIAEELQDALVVVLKQRYSQIEEMKDSLDQMVAEVSLISAQLRTRLSAPSPPEISALP